jgi:hypothetical protein
MASAISYSSFVPSYRNTKNIDIIISYWRNVTLPDDRGAHAKFAIRSFFVRRTINEQGQRNGFQASSVTAIIGFGAAPLPGLTWNS